MQTATSDIVYNPTLDPTLQARFDRAGNPDSRTGDVTVSIFGDIVLARRDLMAALLQNSA